MLLRNCVPFLYYPVMAWFRWLKHTRLLFVFAGFILVAGPEWPAFGSEAHQLNQIVGLRQFDFLVWQLDSARIKAEGVLGSGPTFISPDSQQAVVLEYLDWVRESRRLDREINAIYTDPEVSNPDAATSDLQSELAEARAQFLALQPIAEGVLQQQVAQILAEEGFTSNGEVWPPVLITMTPTPLLLIISPRENIERSYQIPLVHGLSTVVRDGMETAVFDDLDLSALVVPIGGLGTYPSMITETSNVNWLAEVTAHEWGHVWLGVEPLARNYSLDPQVRTINETAVSIFGEEIGARVIERFYPEYVPDPPPPPVPESETETGEPEVVEPPPFDFRAEMAATRVEVDALLAEGQVEEAEAYMETRRQLFVENGYQIRKINQAYFAFYGAYADQPGAAGTDPIGPLVRLIWEDSESLHAFMTRMAPIGSFAALQEEANAIGEEG